MNIFPLHATDFYKTGHYAQYPEGTEYVYSNFTCRADKFFKRPTVGQTDRRVVFFGLQYVILNTLINTWNEGFFEKDLEYVLMKYKHRMDGALGPGLVGLHHIGQLHTLGYLPIEIKALPEGAHVDIRVPLFTIVNTVKGFGWLTNYLETQISAELMKMIISASTAYEYRRLLDFYADLTGGDKAFVPWQGHDFSFRGMSGIHDAAASGMAHLTSFTGTDTVIALDFLDHYYDGKQTFLGGSVPATEHSVMCMGGQDNVFGNDEYETFHRLITEVYPKGIVSIVSDTWDFWHVLTTTAYKLKDEIMSREGKVVFRPDSGDPVKIICGDKGTGNSFSSPVYKGALQILWDQFGGTVNSKGYRVLDPHVGLIYGDSITLERAEDILQEMEQQGFASTNIVFGIGSYTYQFVTRDTLGMAIKATHGVVNGVPQVLFKQPVTDTGMKQSAAGLLRVEKEHGHYVLYDRQTPEQEKQGQLTTVFKNGTLVKFQTIEEIRKRVLE